jgi:hypothetical protein
MTLDDVKKEIRLTLDELKEATISSHKDRCMTKLEALYNLELIFERG